METGKTSPPSGTDPSDVKRPAPDGGHEPATASRTELKALERSGYRLRYPSEKIGVIVVNNFPSLGKLAALRFLEWVQSHPEGNLALPTGKTPEHFIKTVSHYLKTWGQHATLKELEELGIEPGIQPEMKGLHFIQIDEFYPIHPSQHNSFYYYVEKYYIKGFGLDPGRALLIDGSRIGIPEGMGLEDVWPDDTVDLSLRYRHPVNKLETLQKGVLTAVDEWCAEYEEKIIRLGGIGFFLGGIGPDGHIAFNVTGSDPHTTTRLTPINYETQAASASDLGGIEIARKRHAITIGLETITFNPECTAVIIAAGEAKAGVVRNAVCEPPSLAYPATVLQKLPHARFFITEGAARNLQDRQLVRLESAVCLPERSAEKIVIDLALARRKRLLDLEAGDFRSGELGRILLQKTGKTPSVLSRAIRKKLIEKIDTGAFTRTQTVFLHTAPHHDDIMLGYFPSVVRHIRDKTNQHTFTYMTSGFTAVTNTYALSMMEKLKRFLKTPGFRELIGEGYFSPGNVIGYNRDVWQYLDGVAAKSDHMKHEGEARRMFRCLVEIFEEEDSENLEYRIDELISYFLTQYPGKKDMPHIQRLKGMIREWEADCLWGYLGFDKRSVRHLRLGFYKGELFTEEPTRDRDAAPVLQLLKELHPGVVTVALDPEASGPDTHYKVLQAVAEALRQFDRIRKKDIEIWGYRNVWYRFHPSEADIFVPVSLNMFSLMESAFQNAFVSQKEASFPSHEYDGPFCGLAQQIQVDQYQMIKTCLGREYFYEHERPLIRGTRGFVFIRKMTLDEFYSHAREIRKTTEEGEKEDLP